jgi:hypothetical protein
MRQFTIFLAARCRQLRNRIAAMSASGTMLWRRSSEQRSEDRPDPSVTRITMKPLVPILKNIDTGESDRRLDDLQVKIFSENGRYR